MKQEKVKKRIISCKSTLVQALKQMDLLDCKLLLVYKENIFYSIISIGDIQRAIIKGIDLSEEINQILRKNITLGNEKHSVNEWKELMQKHRMEFLPILNERGELKEVLFWDELFGTEEHEVGALHVPVVIMAGGKGTRLKPITNIIPKPLIPIGDKPIIELITDSFVKAGVNNFYVSVNYKKEMIIRYFEEIPDKSYDMRFFYRERTVRNCGKFVFIKGRIERNVFCDQLRHSYQAGIC